MTKKPGSVKVHLENGIIHHDYVGDQDAATIQAMVSENDKVVGELQAKQEPVLILADFSKLGDHDQSARNALRDYLGTRYFERIAAVGVSSGLQIVGQLLLGITGKSDQVKICDTTDEAMAWLRDR